MATSKLKWTAAQRNLLHHFRTTHAKDPEGARALPSIADAWAQVRTIAARGVPTASAGLGEALTRLRAEFATDVPPPFDAAFELYRIGLVAGLGASSRSRDKFSDWQPERALMALLVRGPMAKVLEVLTSRAPFWLNTGSQWSGGVDTPTLELTDKAPSEFAEPPPTFGVATTFGVVGTGLWSALRMHVDALEAETFAAVNVDAHAFRRAHVDSAARAAVALAFARDGSHAKEELARPAPQDADAVGIAIDLLRASATVGDAAAAVAVIEQAYVHGLTPYAYDLVETFGVDAAPLLGWAIRHLEARKMNAALRKSLLGPLKGALKLVT